MIVRKLCASLLLSSLVLLGSQQSFAQNLPGVSIEEATVSAEVKTLFTLAAQAYPTLFTGASGWRLHGGYTYKFFAGSGIYVGIKDGNVHLLGGQFGNTITPKGNVTAVTTALQNVISAAANAGGSTGGTSADFSSFIVAKTMADMTAKFSSLTMEYGTAIGTLRSSATIKMDVQGQESIDGIATDRLKITLTGNGTTQAYDMWVDSTGFVRKVMLGTTAFTGTQANTLGTGFVSAFLIALSAADNVQLKAAIANEIQNPAVSSKVTKRLVGGIEASTIQVTVAANGANLTAYLSDFGSFSMLTQYSSKVSTMESSFEIIDMKLR